MRQLFVCGAALILVLAATGCGDGTTAASDVLDTGVGEPDAATDPDLGGPDLHGEPDLGPSVDVADVATAADVPPDTSLPADVTDDLVPAEDVPLPADIAVDAAPDVAGPPPACDEAAVLPKVATLAVESGPGSDRLFRDADMAFDASGTLAIVDRQGDLYRQTSDGARTLWVAKVGRTVRGLAFLSTGELVVADSGRGMLLLVYPGGEVRTLVAHLDAPWGLDVDLDDTLYVSEATRGAVTRVDPRTGAWERIADGMGTAPGALAFSPDYATLYVAAPDGGALYALTRDATGTFGPLRPFATLPAAVGPCHDKATNDACTLLLPDGSETSGVCVDDGVGGLVCRQVGPCWGKEDGDECFEYEQGGVCREDREGNLYCRPIGPCDALEEGAPCEPWPGETGVCQPDGSGYLGCLPVGPCTGKEPGDPCEEYEQVGTCMDDGSGYLWCRRPEPCDDKVAGDPCSYPDGPTGTCMDDGGGTLYCRMPEPCDGKVAGDACEPWPGQAGRCVDESSDRLACQPVPACEDKVVGDPCIEYGQAGLCADEGGGIYCRLLNPCDGRADGDDCDAAGQAGRCRSDGGGGLFCVPIGPCEDKAEGDTCIDWSTEAGLCADDLSGSLYCQVGNCRDAAEGDDCQDWMTGRAAVCVAGAEGGLYCDAANPCDGQPLGDPCVALWSELPATCEVSPFGVPFCRVVPPCQGLAAGDRCMTEWGAPGVCSDPGDGTLACMDAQGPCAGLAAGQACSTPDGLEGICFDDGTGVLVCLPDPCAAAELGSACTDRYGAEGVCVEEEAGGLRFCRPAPPCEGKSDGEACTSLLTHARGTCRAGAGGALVCQPALPCDGHLAGDPCTVRLGVEGVCEDLGLGGALWCAVERRGGALHAVETDACGNVYVSDDVTEAVWRISPDGSTLAVVASIDAAPVSSLAFGRGFGGFETETLYVATQGGAALFGVPLDVPGRRIVLPERTDTVPSAPAETPALDCLNLPAAPLSTAELERPRGFHDVAFDAEGYIIGYDGSALVRVDRENALQLYASGMGGVEGMDWLPDGTLVAATPEGLLAIAPSGGQVIIAPDVHAYGVTVGPDGMVYAGDHSKVWRVDPATLEAIVFVDGQLGATPFAPRTIAFDLDASLMYIGSLGESVYVQSLDAALAPVGPPRHLAKVRPSVSYLDGLTVDACGNLYVPNYESSALFRIGPDGEVERYLQWIFEEYGHGLEWGSGIGGWRTDALYLPQPYDENTVVEVVVGLPGRPE